MAILALNEAIGQTPRLTAFIAMFESVVGASLREVVGGDHLRHAAFQLLSGAGSDEERQILKTLRFSLDVAAAVAP